MTRVAGGQALDLDPHAVYLSPLGRRCRLTQRMVDRDGRETARFAYDTINGQQAHGDAADGFVLAHGNWRFMRKVG